MVKTMLAKDAANIVMLNCLFSQSYITIMPKISLYCPTLGLSYKLMY